MPGSVVEMSAMRLGLNDATTTRGAVTAIASAVAITRSGVAKGMTLIVASICRGSTTSNGAKVAIVKLSSIALISLIRAASTRAIPRAAA